MVPYIAHRFTKQLSILFAKWVPQRKN
jgi:hypothetical protein